MPLPRLWGMAWGQDAPATGGIGLWAGCACGGLGLLAGAVVAFEVGEGFLVGTAFEKMLEPRGERLLRVVAPLCAEFGDLVAHCDERLKMSVAIAVAPCVVGDDGLALA